MHTYMQTIHTYIHNTHRYHIVASYNGQTMRLFTDGVPIATSTTQSGDILYPASAKFSIGAYIDGVDVYTLRGAIDDVAIWNRAVAVDAVAAMYATQRDFDYFCCPSLCPVGTVPTGLCVGDVSVDCRPAYSCPVCTAGMCVFVVHVVYILDVLYIQSFV